jgi:hypothetical protein
MFNRPKVFNSAGEEVKLSRMEQAVSDNLQRKLLENALGFEIDITTLTTIVKEVSEQIFYKVPFADYLPVRVGQGAWSSNLVTYTSFRLGDAFETGVINTGGNNGRLAVMDAGVSSQSIEVINWAKQIGYTLFELQQASKSGNWDLVQAKESARKENWDLGLQQIAFLGSASDSNVLGLFNQAGVTVDTTTLVQAISTLSTVDLKAFCTTVLSVYRVNNNHTCWPDTFTIPESDYLGLAAPASADFPIKSVLEQLLDTFKTMTNNPNFKILPSAYGDKSVSGLTYQQYALYRQDPKSGRMDLPVDYTSTLANSLDNFSFQNVAYGQYTGVKWYRPLELYYFHF